VTTDLAQIIAGELTLPVQQIVRSIELFDQDNTVPFVARYRKEVTGGLDEVQLRAILERLTYLRNLESRKEVVLKSIADQDKLTSKLQTQIVTATTLQEVEDLYLPYKPKRRTRAIIARERGLEPLATRMMAQSESQGNIETIATEFLNEDVATVEDALAGARDIVAELVMENATVRSAIRQRTQREAKLVTTVVDESKDPRGVFVDYYDYRERLSQIPAHRFLAISRGEREGVLKVKLDSPDDDLIIRIQRQVISNPNALFGSHLRAAIADGYKRLLAPSVQTDLRTELTTISDDHAIDMFATNLRQLLLQPPVRTKTVVGIDPGFRTGCKVALVDPTGKFLGGTTILSASAAKTLGCGQADIVKAD
jgi:uncharacterized protein